MRGHPVLSVVFAAFVTVALAFDLAAMFSWPRWLALPQALRLDATTPAHIWFLLLPAALFATAWMLRNGTTQPHALNRAMDTPRRRLMAHLMLAATFGLFLPPPGIFLSLMLQAPLALLLDRTAKPVTWLADAWIPVLGATLVAFSLRHATLGAMGVAALLGIGLVNRSRTGKRRRSDVVNIG